MTVTSTTISGAKSITYESTASGAAITTGAGADLIVFQDEVILGSEIATNSGNDSIQFLKAAAFNIVDLGAGADSVSVRKSSLAAALLVVVQARYVPG